MDYRSLSNRKLIKLCVREVRDERAWAEFVRRFDGHIKIYAMRECRNKISNREKNQLVEIIQDRVCEVYEKLVSKDCKALRDFVGRSENSIYDYLKVITRNIVRNWATREKRTYKRPQIEKSLDDLCKNTPLTELGISFGHNPELTDELDYEAIREDIEKILNSYLRGNNKERNKLIFKMHFYEGFTDKEIVAQLPYSLKMKTVENILSHLRKIVQNGLSSNKRDLG